MPAAEFRPTIFGGSALLRFSESTLAESSDRYDPNGTTIADDSCRRTVSRPSTGGYEYHLVTSRSRVEPGIRRNSLGSGVQIHHAAGIRNSCVIE